MRKNNECAENGECCTLQENSERAENEECCTLQENSEGAENGEGSSRQGNSECTELKACCGSHKTKERTAQEYKSLIHRLNRIEGQVRGIRRMVENDVYCTDILVQVAAVNAALNSFNKELLANHIKTCVTRDIREGKEETVDELVAVLQKVMK